MRLCIDCRFFASPNLCNRARMLEGDRAKPTISPVDGGEMLPNSTAPVFSALIYRTAGDCGMEAKFFEGRKVG